VAGALIVETFWQRVIEDEVDLPGGGFERPDEAGEILAGVSGTGLLVLDEIGVVGAERRQIGLLPAGIGGVGSEEVFLEDRQRGTVAVEMVDLNEEDVFFRGDLVEGRTHQWTFLQIHGAEDGGQVVVAPAVRGG